MKEHEINIAARIIALETILVHVAKIAFVQSGVTVEGIDHLRKDAAAKLSAEGLPGFEPAVADHLSAEIETAVDDLIVKIRSSVSSARSQLSGEFGPA